jgi:hypothetical protein
MMPNRCLLAHVVVLLTLVTVSSAQAALASGPDFSALRAAVEAFNAQSLSSPIGKDQPPLSVEEVVAAIRLTERTEHPAATDALFGSLQRIATTGKLPPGAQLEVLTGLDRGGAFLFDVWYVRMMLPKDEGGTYSFPIRSRTIRSRPVGEVARELEKRLREMPPLPGRYRLEERLKELKARAATATGSEPNPTVLEGRLGQGGVGASQHRSYRR